MYIKYMEPRKRANMLVFDGQWKVVVENNHHPRKQVNVLASEGLVVENSHRPQKRAGLLVFDGQWKVVTVENNHCPRKRANMLASEGLEGGGGGEQPLPSKTSKCARFRWPVEGGGGEQHRPRKRANVLASEGLEGGGDGEQPPPSKTSKCAHFRGVGR